MILIEDIQNIDNKKDPQAETDLPTNSSPDNQEAEEEQIDHKADKGLRAEDVLQVKEDQLAEAEATTGETPQETQISINKLEVVLVQTITNKIQLTDKDHPPLITINTHTLQ